jgi:hypothetical protein
MPTPGIGARLGCRRVCGVVLEGGTLTSSAAGRSGSWYGAACSAGNGVGSGRGVVGTLLGPEGADPMPGLPGVGAFSSPGPVVCRTAQRVLGSGGGTSRWPVGG